MLDEGEPRRRYGGREMSDELTTETVAIASLKPYGKNPRVGHVDAIARSLEKNGQYRPIVANRRDRTILAGNHTWKAAQQLGWDSISVTFVDVDDEQARRIVLVDNRSNDIASYDEHALAELLSSVVEEEGVLGLVGTGFNETFVDDLVTRLSGPPGLEELAADYNAAKAAADDGLEAIVVRVTAATADQWRAHRRGFDDDDEALSAIL
jgi:hypothetical protein